MMSIRVLIYISIVVGAIVFGFLYNFELKSDKLPVVAIANYGPHSSIEDSIEGLKAELRDRGFIDNKTINYVMNDVGFDASLIPQMVDRLKRISPKVMVVLTTPVAQFAKGSIGDLPLVYSVVTDPLEAKLLKEFDKPDRNMTGSADKQDLKLVIDFALKLMPSSKTVGLLYSTYEANDHALVKMLEEAAKSYGMQVLAVSVDKAMDIPIAMNNFKNKVDFIYVGTSGATQPALPMIAAASDKMGIPIINVNDEAVKNGLVLASFGVNYKQVGANTAKIVSDILKGKSVSQIKPSYPSKSDHYGVVNSNRASALGISISDEYSNVIIVR